MTTPALRTKLDLPEDQERLAIAAIRLALEEDAPSLFDVTTDALIPKSSLAEARFLAKADGVLAGLRVAEAVFEVVDPELRVAWTARDGDRVARGTYFGTVTGSAHSLLIAERLALNFLQRMSGIATATRAYVDAVGPHKAKILDTRKTSPCLRVLDKLAVRLGGGTNHRLGLYDMAMIKDNHVTAAGGVAKAVARMRAFLKERKLEHVPIEIEASTLEEVKEVLEAHRADSPALARVLLDNMVRVGADGAVDTSLLRAAVELVNHEIPSEASGNVTLKTVPAIAATGVEYISSGALTHSVVALDISLKIKELPAPT